MVKLGPLLGGLRGADIRKCALIAALASAILLSAFELVGSAFA